MLKRSMMRKSERRHRRRLLLRRRGKRSRGRGLKRYRQRVRRY